MVEMYEEAEMKKRVDEKEIKIAKLERREINIINLLQ